MCLSINNTINANTTNMQVTDQRYNETALCLAINATTNANSTNLQVTDQRYNETSWVISQNYLTSFDEIDPIFLENNQSIWDAIALKLE